MRRIPNEAANAVTFCPAENTAATTMSYDISLLTPMFGGDTKPWEPNEQRPIRESSVKGHLRFWWRTMQDEASIENLRARENALFGATGRASRVSVKVVHLSSTPLSLEVSAHGVRAGGHTVNYPLYVLFPLIPRHGATCIEKCRFRLLLTLDNQLTQEQRNSVQDAVSLWVLFGGVGARTRRGCGSLYCEEIMRSFQDEASIRNFITRVTEEQQPTARPYPRIKDAVLAVAPSMDDDPVEEWSTFLDRDGYGRVRQRDPRDPGGARPGRSHWPEPDSIRHITGAFGHVPRHPVLAADKWFPRAAYGMPLQIEFRNAAGDPGGKYFVRPIESDRWASPVILKVLKLGNGAILKVCLIFSQCIPSNLEVAKKLPGGKPFPLHPLSPTEHPDAYAGKESLMGDKATIPESPYDTLVRKLGLTRI